MTTWPDLSALELLVAVADHSSISAAATAIGMSQPNASRSLGRLERALDLSLVTRSTAGARLTPDGLIVAEWARDVLRSATVLTHGSTGLAGKSSGALAVSASQTVAEHLLPAWLAALRAASPASPTTDTDPTAEPAQTHLTVQVDVTNSETVLASVLAGTCHIGFVEGPRAPRGVHSIVVAHDELVLVVGPNHPWRRRRTPITASELAATPLIGREPGSGTRVRLDTELQARVGRNATVHQVLSSNAAVRVAVQAGGGAAVLSRLSVADALATATVLEVPLALDLARDLRAVWTGPRRLAGPAATLVAIARASSQQPRPKQGTARTSRRSQAQ